jgi:hypothetical protein
VSCASLNICFKNSTLVSAIQEHKMIVKAVNDGVSPERLRWVRDAD